MFKYPWTNMDLHIIYKLACFLTLCTIYCQSSRKTIKIWDPTFIQQRWYLVSIMCIFYDFKLFILINLYQPIFEPFVIRLKCSEVLV